MHTSHLYTKLTREGGYNFDKVKAWTTRGQRKADLFEKDVVFFPRHFGRHWTLCVAFIVKRRIEYFDSLAMAGGQAGAEVMQTVERYLRDYHVQERGTQLADKWEHVDHKNNCPQQTNGNDCGVFMCCYVTYLSNATKFDFAQHDIAYFRQRIAVDILQHAVDESNRPFLANHL
jgi:Ulp1 family protease